MNPVRNSSGTLKDTGTMSKYNSSASEQNDFISNGVKNKIADVKIEVSARHIHLTKADLEKLFGAGYKLTPRRRLSQENEFAAEETVDIKTAKKAIGRVRVLGPTRDYSQVEISLTDAYHLGLKPPARMSGELSGTPGIVLVGPKGELKLKQGVILAQRHIHCSPAQAKKYNLRHKQAVKVKIGGARALFFDRVLIKVKSGYNWHMHLDTDEANTAGINRKNCRGEVFLKYE